MFKYITNNIGEKMSDIWIIILILEGSLGLIISKSLSHHTLWFTTFGLILLSLGIYGIIKKF